MEKKPSTSASTIVFNNVTTSSTFNGHNLRPAPRRKSVTITPLRQAKIQEFFSSNADNPDLFTNDGWKNLLVKAIKDPRVQVEHLDFWIETNPWIMASVNGIRNSRRGALDDYTESVESDDGEPEVNYSSQTTRTRRTRRVRFMGMNNSLNSTMKMELDTTTTAETEHTLDNNNSNNLSLLDILSNLFCTIFIVGLFFLFIWKSYEVLVVIVEDFLYEFTYGFTFFGWGLFSKLNYGHGYGYGKAVAYRSLYYWLYNYNYYNFMEE